MLASDDRFSTSATKEALPLAPSAQSVSVPASKQPAHEAVYQQLRAQILFGELAPGQAVTIQGLVEHSGAGMTPVREAIRRLISDGALVFQGNRRVSVPLLSEADIDELLFARVSLECELARRAARHITDDAIEALAQIDETLDQAIAQGDIRRYLELNYTFHKQLDRHADAPILRDLADRLWLRFGPSLRIICGRVGTQNVQDHHKDILSGLRQRNADLVALAMERDVVQGMEQMRQGLAQGLSAD
ncbi:HTH-type transcriptional regulator McbR [Tritonibacter multivorans]|uniref:HTH-type transcriptional regulator McbR n=1 Tax=Tritonibacter multivorans TaxID=928856 RepID=A0A0P1GEG9_9RHOB|nr:GntR family transcriptional regulator [Tritonibacter multivorans]MDA7420173.1 GntR family transcriptional regulator [Tritonibacter multivorans]CUH79829.1 HTH-type transcriptional regulator McbR [Tritonibacter multivorans]SFC01568.1 transcriptional regulator, GntR family [Tritonibacter multivorans]